MKKILVLVPTDFEDVELITPMDIFRREGIDYVLSSPEDKEEVKGKYNAIVKTVPLSKVIVDNFNALFLPGGPGYSVLVTNPEVIKLVKKFNRENKDIYAICAAPTVLDKAGVIGTKNITAFPGYLNDIVKNRSEVVVSDNLITGRDFLSSVAFANEIVKRAKGL